MFTHPTLVKPPQDLFSKDNHFWLFLVQEHLDNFTLTVYCFQSPLQAIQFLEVPYQISGLLLKMVERWKLRLKWIIKTRLVFIQYHCPQKGNLYQPPWKIPQSHNPSLYALSICCITHSQDNFRFERVLMSAIMTASWSLITYPAQKVEKYHHCFQAFYTGAIHPSDGLSL